MSGQYGFSINVSGNSLNQMKQIEVELQKLGIQAKATAGEVKSGFDEIAQSAGALGKLFLEVFAVTEIINFGRELMHTAAEFEGFENVIRYSSTGIVDAANNLDYIRVAVDRLHLPMKESYEAFSEMQAGFYGTGIEGEKLRKVFEGVAEASAVLHLQPEQFSRVTFAMKEIGELGTLQARQLRMLAFALPGSVNLAAQSLGMTTEQMHEAMKKGEINSSDFLPKFAATLTEHFAKGLPNAGNSLISQMNDQKNTIINLFRDMGESLKPLFVDILKTIADVMKYIKSVWDSITGNANFVNALKTLFDIMVRLLPIWIAYKVVMLAVSAVTSVFAIENGILSASLGSVTVMTDGTTVAMEGLSGAIASTGIGALVVGIGLLIEKFISWNSEIDETIEKLTNIKSITEGYKSVQETAGKIGLAFSNINNLDKTQKGQLASDIASEIQVIKDKLAKEAIPQLPRTQKEASSVSEFNKDLGFNILNPGSMALKYSMSKESEGLKAALKDNKDVIAGYTNQLRDLQAKQAQLQKLGIKPLSYSGAGANPAGTSATNTSSLSGAQGGLGQAKVINIHIDTVQKIGTVSGKGWKEDSQSAIEVLIRTLNNVAYSQSGTM